MSINVLNHEKHESNAYNIYENLRREGKKYSTTI